MRTPETEPVELKLTVTAETRRALETLSRHGLFGTSVEDVADRLLNERLRAIVLEGWLGTPGFPDGRTLPLVRPGR